MNTDFKEILQKNMKNFNDKFEKLEINIYFVKSDFKKFVKSDFKKNEIYTIYKLLADKKDIFETISQSISYIMEESERRSFEKYDLELEINDTVQIICSETVLNGETLIESIQKTSFDKDNILDNTISISMLKNIVIHLYNPEENKNIYFFEKYVSISSKFKKSAKFTLTGTTVQPLKKEIITIHPFIDAILIDENYYVFNRRNFNSIFNYKDYFHKIIEANQETIKNSEFITNTEQFIDDCKENGRHLPRLTKIILAQGFNKVLENKHKLPEIKERYKLKFELDDEGRIKYENKDCITDILNVLLEHYVISALTDREMLAKAIESYTIEVR